MSFLKKISYWRNRKDLCIVMKNTVDKDVQSILRPLNLIPNIMLYPKYFIRENIIIPNTKIFKGLVATITYITFYIYKAYETYTSMDATKLIDFKFFVSTFELFGVFSGYFLIYYLNVIKTNSNIDFVLIYQEVHRFFVTRTDLKNAIIYNWIFFVLLVFWYTCMILAELFTGTEISTCECDLLLAIFDAKIIYAMRLIKLLKDKVLVMNEEILSLKNLRVGQENCEKLFKAYDDILKCYDNMVMSFRLLVSDICSFEFCSLIATVAPSVFG